MSEKLSLDEHVLLDLAANIEIILDGLRYAVVFQDLDTLKKCMVDLKDCLDTMESMIEDEFGESLDYHDNN